MKQRQTMVQSTGARQAAIAAALCASLVACSESAVQGESADMPELTEVWQLEGLAQPESVLHDSQRDVLYVSNINGGPTEQNGRGFISRVGTVGNMLTREWVTGLDAPKGLALNGARLFVADVDALVEIDVAAGAVKTRYPVPDAQFLNDVTVGPDGTVYVSDMYASIIHRLVGGALEVWLKGEQLDHPNGLLAESERLVVGTWGALEFDAEGARRGHMLTISYGDGIITSLGGGQPLGNLDGVEALGDGSYYVTDWVAGKLLRVHADGSADELLSLGRGTADHEYLQQDGRLYIPLMLQDKLMAYTIR